MDELLEQVWLKSVLPRVIPASWSLLIKWLSLTITANFSLNEDMIGVSTVLVSPYKLTFREKTLWKAEESLNNMVSWEHLINGKLPPLKWIDYGFSTCNLVLVLFLDWLRLQEVCSEVNRLGHVQKTTKCPWHTCNMLRGHLTSSWSHVIWTCGC